MTRQPNDIGDDVDIGAIITAALDAGVSPYYVVGCLMKTVKTLDPRWRASAARTLTNETAKMPGQVGA